MAVQTESGGKDEVKTQFVTREGAYRLMTLSEYSRPNRVGYTGGSGASPVRVSLVTLPPAPGVTPSSDAADDRICFNHGKELYVYVYRGVKKAADLTKPVEKKIYKGTNPTCHDFNAVTITSESVSLIIGFSTGQIQLIDPIKKELSKLYNEERLIDKTRVTCIKWVPGSSNLFVAAHASGQLYVYNEELAGGAGAAPHYQLFKQGEGYSVHTCRAKSTRNPLYRWLFADNSCVNEFAFSPCGANLAVVTQDGLLRVFHYDTMELVGRARSYFGGFLCVCWSPDGKYVVVGGEDDLVTVWSFGERRVVARGQGHRSWVSVVAFDPYVTSFTDPEEKREKRDGEPEAAHCYRLGSVSQDTQLCLWDLTEDVLRPPVRTRVSAHLSPALSPNGVPGTKPLARTAAKTARKSDAGGDASTIKPTKPTGGTLGITVGKKEEGGAPLVNSLTQRLAGFSFGERKPDHRRNFSLNVKPGGGAAGGGSVALRGRSAGGGGSGGSTASGDSSDPLRLIGTAACPRFDECPVLEPLVCKKIAHERLTALLFRADYLVTACADGCVNTWARPARPHNGDVNPQTHTHPHSLSHPHPHAHHHRRFDRIDLVD
ncbi:WD repeat-containing protein 20 [Eumeta japonica]|uniref:WD repeat-containing protein 20 n=1 Tax=Eumeta variegata TaxID=151549 RepID=A0A4C1UAE9_EUMVA|nr:WD repeat-containing protein 20 [Eumeta japonica]